MALELETSEFGAGGPVTVVLHGLFGSGRNWAGVAKALAAEGRRLVAADLRNHGASPWADGMDYALMAEDVAALVRKLGAPVDLVGHSMGGKTAMMLALAEPELVRRLAVVDIAPVAYEHDHRAFVEAMRAIDPAAAESRQAVDNALAPAVEDPGVRAFLLQNLAREGDGFRWRLNLEAIARAMDALAEFAPPADAEPLPDLPVLALAGADSPYVDAAGFARFKELFPAVELERIDGAGHWPHAEQPQAVIAALDRFLTR